MDANSKEINGFFNILDQEIFGTLKLNGEDTLITFKSKSPIPPLSDFHILTGIGFDHKVISCLQCIEAGSQHDYHHGGIEYTASVFPHYASIGYTTLNNTENTITEVCFTTNDLPTLFNDRSAFGHLFSTENQLKALLTKNHETIKQTTNLNYEFSPPEISETPHVFYWTGKLDIFKCDTQIGALTITHSPSFSVDGKSGITCENNITANLKFNDPISFDKTIDNISTFARFFSIVAGRTQKTSDIKIKKLDSLPDNHLEIYCSYSSSISAPPLQGANDAPLNPIHRPDEFSAVLQNWIIREPEWSIGRIQYLNGLNKNRSYDTDRLVSAANAFDILPSKATLPNKEITQEYNTAREECIKILETLPKSDDRAAAIGVMKRWGRANLRSKVLHRAEIVKSHCPQISDGIDRVLVLAIKTRNYFVHGSDDFKYKSYEEFLPLFTDALEFVFSASDIIECGWDPKAWLETRPSYSHNYSYFIKSFKNEIKLLKLVEGEAKHWPT
ncbi:ApeA N-terminal domain 1-containing protein [Pseudomonas sp. LB3P58]